VAVRIAEFRDPSEHLLRDAADELDATTREPLDLLLDVVDDEDVKAAAANRPPGARRMDRQSHVPGVEVTDLAVCLLDDRQLEDVTVERDRARKVRGIEPYGAEQSIHRPHDDRQLAMPQGVSVSMWLPGALAALTLIPTHTWIHAGPALAGSRVAWATNTGAVYTAPRVRRIRRPPRVAPPVLERVTTLAASARRVAFIRRVELLRSCDVICPHEPREVVSSDLFVGPPFTWVNGAPALDVDVSGRSVLFSDTGRVVLDGKMLAESHGFVAFASVALAGRFAAWTEVPSDRNFTYVPRSLVIYDVRAQRIAYRLSVAPFVDIDLASDGTVAFGEDPTPVGGPHGRIGWASVAEPWPHFLPGDAIPDEVRIARGRVVSFSAGELTVRSLAGAVVARVAAAYGGFDFDGRRLAYLYSPKVVAIARIR
jgi:hypothetical protein